MLSSYKAYTQHKCAAGLVPAVECIDCAQKHRIVSPDKTILGWLVAMRRKRMVAARACIDLRDVTLLL